jgi:hypothetical protein
VRLEEQSSLQLHLNHLPHNMIHNPFQIVISFVKCWGVVDAASTVTGMKGIKGGKTYITDITKNNGK